MNGAALESGSWKVGQFNDQVLSFDILLGDGRLVTCSPTQNEDLFYGISGAYGSVGLVVLVKIALQPATQYVRIRYFPCSAWEQVKDMIE